MFKDRRRRRRQWRWVAAVSAGVFATAVTATTVISDGATATASLGQTPAPTTGAPPTRTVIATAAPTPDAAPNDPRTVVYSVSGSRLPGDLVTVAYTDRTGALRTDLNVSLPWTRTVVLDRNVTMSWVTATSTASRLNCAITDGLGSLLAAQRADANAASCNRWSGEPELVHTVVVGALQPLEEMGDLAQAGGARDN